MPPTGPLRLGLDDVENTVGWALTDSAAAAVYGAPLAVRTGQLLDFYVPDQVTLRHRATAGVDVVDRLLGEVPQLQVLRAARGAEPLHVDLWLVSRRRQALRWIHSAGGTDLPLDDLDLVAELLLAACAQR